MFILCKLLLELSSEDQHVVRSAVREILARLLQGCRSVASHALVRETARAILERTADKATALMAVKMTAVENEKENKQVKMIEGLSGMDGVAFNK